MPTIIDYPAVLARMAESGLRCVYPNSGAFGFASGEMGRVVGWTSGGDSTIKPGLPAEMIRFDSPAAPAMVKQLIETWLTDFPGPVWLVPKSHWSFELQHGNGPWLSPLLTAAGVDPAGLIDRTTAAAIEFQPDEAARLNPVIVDLLQKLTQSDFALLFPGHATLVTIHHHGQIWWQSIS